MSRITDCFKNLQEEKRKGLIPFIVAGDPKPGFTLPLMKALVDGGADLIELGVPFSDPMADGPAIQGGSERALAHGTTLHDVIDMVASFRKNNQQTPVILMGYLNPVEIMGYEDFAKSAAEAGVDGVIIVDIMVSHIHATTTPTVQLHHQCSPILINGSEFSFQKCSETKIVG